MKACRRFFRMGLLELFGLASLVCIWTAATVQGSDLVSRSARFLLAITVVTVFGIGCGSNGKARMLHFAFVGGAVLYYVIDAMYEAQLGIVSEIGWNLYLAVTGEDNLDLPVSSVTFFSDGMSTARCGLTIFVGLLSRRLAYAVQPED